MQLRTAGGRIDSTRMTIRRVFVTGGAGTIGLELAPRLVKLRATVLVGDLKPTPERLATSRSIARQT